MSKRLQVLLSDEEIAAIQEIAHSSGISVGEWVRTVLREARAQAPKADAQAKLAAVREAAQYSFPTADLATMLAEIERGYHE